MWFAAAMLGLIAIAAGVSVLPGGAPKPAPTTVAAPPAPAPAPAVKR